MKKSKILEIWKPRKWEWPHGDVFYIPLKLENWENISLGKKSESAFNVWDVVCYETLEEWKKWKEVKENPFRPKSYDNQSNNVGAMIWMSIKLAFEQMYSKDNYEETMVLAKRIFGDAMQMFESYGKNENKSESNSEEDNNDDINLPF